MRRRDIRVDGGVFPRGMWKWRSSGVDLFAQLPPGFRVHGGSSFINLQRMIGCLSVILAAFLHLFTGAPPPSRFGERRRRSPHEI
jgi:hypothetical protein